ncbi:dynein axonemal intermediate chain 7-like [Phymastichus coffea]|uniref:dynein axonemal intermediate chain 7-like n=1 Tax=Phymastichus coffea TaxID=108790 RepID=UPI00273B4A4A|nr:dynein axonemal intermediate chain 7-like [Phymastichus coffea]XP_058802483.1 dynein axonemal intermediate chain 7-like [Phymastichus coffea]XP_058802484.1 dynein axonemal intermediate chain 7-like [Phymastichus coffea]XP_058802485.1 dynein axonemal intermediate chain 7-like [Phymastichus coffea]XP_058802486.1 dynein axonemal intermediate chain 7-like [Phymastichus coffea]
MSKTEKQGGATADATAELELDKTRLVQELQDEIEQETFNTEQKVKLEEKQMQLRRVQLEKTWRKVSERRKAFMDYTLKCLEEEDWLRYMSCDGLPDPAALPELNAFLFLWSLEDDHASMKTLPRQCEVVIYLIRKLDKIIQFSIKAAPAYIQDCKHIRQTFRDKLQQWVDMASYSLLRQIDRDTIRVDLKNAKYVQQLTPLVCCFWAFIRLPISIKQVSEKDKKPIEVDFEEVGLTIKMPLDLDCYCTAIRVLWLSYDHYSDLSHTSVQPQVPEKLRMDMDLQQFCEREHGRLKELRESQRESRQQRLEEKRAMIERILNPPVVVEKSKHDRKGKKGGHSKGKPDHETEHIVAPPPQLESPEEIVFREESEIMKETWKALGTLCSKKKKEINLRKYTMLGGLYRIDLIRQPPQPKDMRRNIFLTTLQLPKELEFVEFTRPYKAPPAAPENERTPEVIETEMKALEAAMEKLALVTLKLPESVMWFEPPLVAHWLPDEGIWSTEDIHDIKYNEEKQTITFRTGRLGIHGLAGCRFINLPFQSWELKPESAKSSGGGGVLLTISGAIIQLEFLVREDLVCLHSVVGGAPALKALTHNFMTLQALTLTLRAAGCDIFPDEDSIHHVKSVRKHPVVSRHLEACMGLLSTTYVFAWSRWNNQRGSREIAVQIKEIHGCIAKERSNAILLVTPFRTMVVNCSEVSSEYSGEPSEEHDKFYADVYHYALHNAGIKSRLAMKNVSYKLSTTITNLLRATNIINMSA